MSLHALSFKEPRSTAANGSKGVKFPPAAVAKLNRKLETKRDYRHATAIFVYSAAARTSLAGYPSGSKSSSEPKCSDPKAIKVATQINDGRIYKVGIYTLTYVVTYVSVYVCACGWASVLPGIEGPCKGKGTLLCSLNCG